jgi:hypothetical protein
MTAVIVVLALVLLAVGAVLLVLRSRRMKEREQLRERFGPEYDRAVEHHGGQRSAEHHLAAVADRRDKAEIRELSADERDRFSTLWTKAQAEFVDDPRGATSNADELVGEVMRERGYPLDEVDDRGDLVAADHAELARHYRAAHAIGERAHEASTEELRQAFVHYRHLFTELLGADSTTDVAGTTDVTGTDATDTMATRDGSADRRSGADGTDRRTELEGRQLEGQQELDLTAGERTSTSTSTGRTTGDADRA